MDIPIRRLIDQVVQGQIRVPAFQRSFVWEPNRVAYLMDSIFKGYPYGTVLLWRTREQLKTERTLGPYQLPPHDEDYPIDYVLDGQQRLTSIFGVFQHEMEPTEEGIDWLPIYFNFRADADAQERQFEALHPEDADPESHFPLSVVFQPLEFHNATAGLAREDIETLSKMQQRFQEAQVPAQVFETDDQASVAIVFERVNRLGVELDTFQLLAAWTWSDDFDLLDSFRSLSEELEPHGFEAVGEDTNLLLRCASAMVAGDPSIDKLVRIHGSELRNKFDRVTNGIRGAIDFLHENLRVHNLKTLPYPTVLITLSCMFAADEGESVSLTANRSSTTCSRSASCGKRGREQLPTQAGGTPSDLATKCPERSRDGSPARGWDEPEWSLWHHRNGPLPREGDGRGVAGEVAPAVRLRAASLGSCDSAREHDALPPMPPVLIMAIPLTATDWSGLAASTGSGD